MQMPNVVALIVLASGVLAACSSSPVAPPPAQSAAPVVAAAPKPAPATAPAPVPAVPAAPKPMVSTAVDAAALPPHLDPKSLISTERSVYFDFDVFAVKGQYAAMIERQGKYLASKPTLSIKIEGHADERGGAEYNLALGHKRALAVQQALKLLGVKDGQLDAVSWGKERPRATGHDEAAWAENRRADLIYPKP